MENKMANDMATATCYHWPQALLKKHGVELQHKKLTSVHHAGKAVLGLTLPNWALGAIEVTH